jgi:class 3 adenylate cyclase
MFALRTDENGKVYAGEKDGQLIENVKDNPHLAELEEWSKSLTPPVDLAGTYPAAAVLFFDRETLAEYCRRYGAMLYVEGDHFLPGARTIINDQAWRSLMRAVAVRPEAEGPQNPAGIAADFTLLWVPQSLFDNLSAVFAGSDDNDPLWRVSSRPVKRAFVYLDVSGFSKYPPGQEALVINSLVNLTGYSDYWQYGAAGAALNSMEAQLCIGDGYIYVFPDALKATLFAAYMAELIEQLVGLREQMRGYGLPVEFHFRMGVHYGPVYRFWDPGRNCWNYIGDGINGGNRVLSVIDKKYDDIVFVSDAVANEFIAQHPGTEPYSQVRNCMENRGRQDDKHGKPWRVFLLNHTQLCEPILRSVVLRQLPSRPAQQIG